MTAIYRRNGYCTVCEKASAFSADYDWYRDHLRCETCGSIPRERAAALMISRHRPNWRNLVIHESGPEPRGISLKLQRDCPKYTASNLIAAHPLGAIVDGLRNENLEAQTFESASFDIVVALDVLEHVNRPDDALAEIARTLKPGGCLIFTVPTYKERVTSERRARYLEDGGVEHLAKPEFHGNPISDEGSLVTFHYGYDLAQAVFEWSGLDVEVSRFHDNHLGLIGEFTEVYVATRNAEQSPVAGVSVGSFVDSGAPGTTPIARSVATPPAGRAAAADVPADVHPDDLIFQFLWNNPVFATKQDALGYYYDQGRESAQRVRDVIEEWMPGRNEPLAILEFAAGYGAVTRHLQRLLLPNKLTASDIHPAANSFISSEFEVPTLRSARLPEALVLPHAFDVIFALSFFSHMPITTWSRWLRQLYEGVAPGGLLFFTTHGMASSKHFPHAVLDDKGYWFDASSEQGDLDVADYGQTLTSKDFVDAQIARLPRVEYLSYQPALWWGHQDLYILRRH